MARIYRDAAERQKGALRRWQRVAIAGTALAAGVLLFALLRVEVEVGGGQFVVRWGPRPQPSPVELRPEPRVIVQQTPVADALLEERVKLLGDLVRTLTDDLDTRDRQRRADIALLVTKLDVMRQHGQRRYEENRRDVGALYTAQFGNRD